MSEIAINLEHVSKRFVLGEKHTALRDLVPAIARRVVGRPKRSPDAREFWALKDINLQVPRGQAIGVIGHNGAGKSTMLKHFAGIMTPTTGRMTVHGRLSALIEVGAGFHHDLTGRENVFLNGVILGMSRAEVARKFDEIVEFAGLSAFIDTPVKRYSSGMYARLGFSVAAHLDPDILVIDEVLSVGDMVFQRKSLEKMRSVAAGGATVVFVSHNLKGVSDLCDRAVLLDAGTIVEDGATPDVIQTYLAREREKMTAPRDADVVISDVRLRGVNGESVHFEAGEKAWLDVKMRANRPVQNVTVIMHVCDDSLDEVFNTSTERLTRESLDLEAGETASCTFEVDMHLANGTFHVGVYLYRYDDQTEYDRVLPAATFFMESDIDVRGVAHLYPRVISSRVGGSEE